MIVSNTTPLSNFLHIDRVDILQYLFTHVHIPFAVQEEIEEYFHGSKQWKKCLDAGFICVHHVQHSIMLNSLHLLHRVEMEALTLYLEKQGKCCLLDDKDARVFAKLYNINLTGTLGILIEAKNKGIIPAVQPFMDTLRNKHSFWISEKMYQHVLLITHER